MGLDETPTYVTAPVNEPAYPNYAPAPVYDAGQPVYAQQAGYPAYPQPGAYPAQPNYQPGYGEAIVVSTTTQNNLPLGFICGLFCGLFGLCCVLLVEEKNSYLKGWAIAFVILLIIGFILGFVSVFL